MKRLGLALTLSCSCLLTPAAQTNPPDRQRALDAMKRATTFMVEKVSTNGGYVWTYLPDLSRRWGEMEARDSMIWIQPPGTPAMGHLFLDAYHATGDDYYYRAAEQVAGALIWGQHPSGGWNYMVDFAGDRSLRDWYATVGRNGWRLEEFQHYWGNATFDDAGTADAARLLLRIYVEKRDPKYKPALDKAIQFFLDSQYPIGAWPQRFPAPREGSYTNPDYTAYYTFNDDVAAENIDFLVLCYQTLGDPRLLDPIVRGMNAVIVTQLGMPQPGWSMQYTPDLKPAAARTYEPRALTTHTTAGNIELLLEFYRLTGETKFLARIPEALDWLDSVKLSADLAASSGRTHPTFVELETNKPLYVHRTGSNVVNGRYYADYNPSKTIVHYSAFRRLDVAGLRKRYEQARALSPAEATKGSPLVPGAGVMPLPRFFAVNQPSAAVARDEMVKVTSLLNAQGYWPGKLETTTHPFKRHGQAEVAAGDFSQTQVGDDTDTSPFPDDRLLGISTAEYIRNMSVLIRFLEATRTQSSAPARDSRPIAWTIDNLTNIGGHAVTVAGAPRVVSSSIGRAVEFNGQTDGLFLDVNPLEGLARFSVEVLFEPAPGGPEEQRFLHFEETGSTDRMLVELRMPAAQSWYLDTYLRDGETGLTLIDDNARHPAGRWHTAALTYDGETMAHYVNGKRERQGTLRFSPLGPGRTSIGVRQNRVSWFKGRIRQVRITPEALTPDRFLTTPDS